MKKRLDLIFGSKQSRGACGPYAIKPVILYKKGLNIPEKELIEIAGTTEEDGTSVNGMIKIAEKFNLDYIIKNNSSISDLEESIKNDNPVILLIQALGDGHYILGKKCDSEKKVFSYFDPYYGEDKTLSYKKLLKKWHDKDEKTNYPCFGMYFL